MNEFSGPYGQSIGEDQPIPPGVDPSAPSIARVYDYVLGGTHHYESDRRAAKSMIDALPETPMLARNNRLFLRRAVSYLVADAGIRQIIDIGSGLPTAGNVHEIAHDVDPSVRVVYVDNDPLVLAYGRALLAANPNTTMIVADLRQPDSIFGDVTTREYIDLTEPFAVLTASILHHLTDDENPEGVATALKDRLPSGGYLLSANFLSGDDPRAPRIERALLDGGLGTGRFRTREEQLRYFDGLELVDPGFGYANDWRPDGETPHRQPGAQALRGRRGPQALTPGTARHRPSAVARRADHR